MMLENTWVTAGESTRLSSEGELSAEASTQPIVPPPCASMASYWATFTLSPSSFSLHPYVILVVITHLLVVLYFFHNLGFITH